MKKLLVRPRVSIVVFHKDSTSIKPIVDSLSALPDLMRRLLEFTLVVYDKKLDYETEQLTFSLRRFMRSGFKDYTERHPETDLSYYGVAKTVIEKKASDVVTADEIQKLIQEGIK